MENQSEESLSPLPKSESTRTFPEALKWVILGFKITKLEWGDVTIYCYLHEGILKIHKHDGKDYNLIVSEADLVGEDWILVEEMN